MNRFDISVYTAFKHADGSLFADLGTFVWPDVSEEIRQWFVGSCRATAFKLVSLDAHPGGYTLEYRTIVKRAGTGEPVSDTGLITFEQMSYADVIQFEHWALHELGVLIKLFEAEHVGKDAPAIRRSKIATFYKWFLAWWYQ